MSYLSWSLIFAIAITFLWGFLDAYLKNSPEYSFVLPNGVTSGVTHAERKIHFRQHLLKKDPAKVDVSPTFAVGEVVTVELSRVKMLPAVAHLWQVYLTAVDYKEHKDGKTQSHLLTFGVEHREKGIPEGVTTVKLEIVKAGAKTFVLDQKDGKIFTLQEDYIVKVVG